MSPFRSRVIGLKSCVLLPLFGLALSGCAGSQQFHNDLNVAATDMTAATITVVRHTSVFGSAMVAPIFVNQTRVGELGPGGDLTVRVPAGEVHVASTMGDVTIQAQGGWQYYFEVDIPFQFSINTPRYNIKEVAPVTAEGIAGHDLAVAQK